MTTPRVLAGRYRLVTELGHGSMGIVWDAYDTVLLRRVAIKQVNFPSGIPHGEASRLADRTLREARAIAALSHPHVVTLFDIVSTADGPAIVMELLQSRSLAEILAQHGALPAVDAAVIGRAVASGLLAAHGAGITHRDVKPANVLISDDGRIKLTDFGIARAAGEQTLTATGMLLGSPAYISPEVAAGRPASPSADAWGLGALLFAVTEGRPPFDEGKPIATLTAVVSDPVPPHPHSGPLAPVIDGLLVKDPGLRMTLGDAFRELDRIAGTAGFVPPSAPTAGKALQPAPPALPTLSRAPLSLPPPPWAGQATEDLAPLPARAPARSRAGLLAAAVLTVIVAAVLGYAMVWYLAHPG